MLVVVADSAEKSSSRLKVRSIAVNVIIDVLFMDSIFFKQTLLM